MSVSARWRAKPTGDEKGGAAGGASMRGASLRGDRSDSRPSTAAWLGWAAATTAATASMQPWARGAGLVRCHWSGAAMTRFAASEYVLDGSLHTADAAISVLAASSSSSASSSASSSIITALVTAESCSRTALAMAWLVLDLQAGPACLVRLSDEIDDCGRPPPCFAACFWYDRLRCRGAAEPTAAHAQPLIVPRLPPLVVHEQLARVAVAALVHHRRLVPRAGSVERLQRAALAPLLHGRPGRGVAAVRPRLGEQLGRRRCLRCRHRRRRCHRDTALRYARRAETHAARAREAVARVLGAVARDARDAEARALLAVLVRRATAARVRHLLRVVAIIVIVVAVAAVVVIGGLALRHLRLALLVRARLGRLRRRDARAARDCRPLLAGGEELGDRRALALLRARVQLLLDGLGRDEGRDADAALVRRGPLGVADRGLELRGEAAEPLDSALRGLRGVGTVELRVG
eukprot:scaffold10392_cov57-Phaeocystis_antarctica.AAC.2